MTKTEPAKPDPAAMRAEEHQAFLDFRTERHNRRLAGSLAGMTVTGLRMHPKDDAENGVVVNFTPHEAASVMQAVSRVLSARIDGAKSQKEG